MRTGFLILSIFLVVSSAHIDTESLTQLIPKFFKESSKVEKHSSRLEHINGVDGLPKALGAYSQATKVKLGDYSMLYVAGMIGINPVTNELHETLADQVKQAMINLGVMLTSQGTSFAKVTRSNLFILDMDDFAEMDAIYKSFFDDSLPFPARAAVAVKQLPKGAKFEIQVDALIE